MKRNRLGNITFTNDRWIINDYVLPSWRKVVCVVVYDQRKIMVVEGESLQQSQEQKFSVPTYFPIVCSIPLILCYFPFTNPYSFFVVHCFALYSPLLFFFSFSLVTLSLMRVPKKINRKSVAHTSSTCTWTLHVRQWNIAYNLQLLLVVAGWLLFFPSYFR